MYHIYIYIYIYIYILVKIKVKKIIYIHTSNYYTLHEKKTKYKDDTARSMLCHNNPAANRYKESVTLCSTPQKGKEGI